MKEKILCAAIHYKDGIKYHQQPRNIESGIVFCGFRHGVIFEQVAALNGNKKLCFDGDQGFLTNKNRFVDRNKAAQIAFRAGQISDKRPGLFSEDLY